MILHRLLRRWQIRRQVEDTVPIVRDRLAGELHRLMAQEADHQRLLGLRVRPRLTLVDEEMVVVVHPADRLLLLPDRDEDADPRSDG